MSPRFYADLVCGHSVECSADAQKDWYIWCPRCKVEVVVRRVREA